MLEDLTKIEKICLGLFPPICLIAGAIIGAFKFFNPLILFIIILILIVIGFAMIIICSFTNRYEFQDKHEDTPPNKEEKSKEYSIREVYELRKINFDQKKLIKKITEELNHKEEQISIYDKQIENIIKEKTQEIESLQKIKNEQNDHMKKIAEDLRYKEKQIDGLKKEIQNKDLQFQNIKNEQDEKDVLANSIYRIIKDFESQSEELHKPATNKLLELIENDIVFDSRFDICRFKGMDIIKRYANEDKEIPFIEANQFIAVFRTVFKNLKTQNEKTEYVRNTLQSNAKYFLDDAKFQNLHPMCISFLLYNPDKIYVITRLFEYIITNNDPENADKNGTFNECKTTLVAIMIGNKDFEDGIKSRARHEIEKEYHPIIKKLMTEIYHYTL